MGGTLNNYAPSNDVYNSKDGIKWNLVTNNAQWSPRNSHTSVVLKDAIFLMGGKISNGTASNGVYVTYNGGFSWELITSNSTWTARYDHASLVFNEVILVMGGYDNKGDLNDVYSSKDGVTWSILTKEALWTPRGGMEVLEYNNYLLLLGGFDGQYAFDGVYSSKDGESWELVAQHSQWQTRAFHSVVLYNNQLLLAGGWNGGSGYYNDAWFSKCDNTLMLEIIGISIALLSSFGFGFSLWRFLYLNRKDESSEYVDIDDVEKLKFVFEKERDDRIIDNMLKRIKFDKKKNKEFPPLEDIPITYLNRWCSFVRTPYNGKDEGSLLGSGKFGEVFIGKCPGNLNIVIKRINSPDNERLNREINIPNKNYHENIIKILGHSYCKSDTTHIETAYIIFEYCEKGDLYTMLKKNGEKLDCRKRLDIAIGIAQGLHYLHGDLSSNSALHWDIKSENIVLTKDFTPKIIDFGFSKSTEDANQTLDSIVIINDTQMRRIKGTLKYIDPEYYEFKGKYDIDCEIYSYGIVLLDLVCGLEVLTTESVESLIIAKSKLLFNLEFLPGDDLIIWTSDELLHDLKEIIRLCIAQKGQRICSMGGIFRSLDKLKKLHFP